MENYFEWKKSFADTNYGLCQLIRVLKEGNIDISSSPSLYPDILKINQLAKELNDLYRSRLL